MGTTCSNLPNDYLVYICPQCDWGQAEPVTLVEIEKSIQHTDQFIRDCPMCLETGMTVADSLHRIGGRLYPSMRKWEGKKGE